ncbi:MAG: hypothetical protein AAGI03_00780, partial [Pseudomonadota bacterium]
MIIRGQPGVLGVGRVGIGRGDPFDSLPIPDGDMIYGTFGQSNSRVAGTRDRTPNAKYASGFGDMSILVSEGQDQTERDLNIGSATFQPYQIGINSDPDSGQAVWGSEAEFVWQMRQAGDNRPVYVIKLTR